MLPSWASVFPSIQKYPVFARGSTLWNIAPRECSVLWNIALAERGILIINSSSNTLPWRTIKKLIIMILKHYLMSSSELNLGYKVIYSPWGILVEKIIWVAPGHPKCSILVFLSAVYLGFLFKAFMANETDSTIYKVDFFYFLFFFYLYLSFHYIPAPPTT